MTPTRTVRARRRCRASRSRAWSRTATTATTRTRPSTRRRTEVCDDLDTDEDCDALIDDEDDSLDPKHRDADALPGRGRRRLWRDRRKSSACDVGTGFARTRTTATTRTAPCIPVAPEVCGDSVDDDCDGVADACRLSDEVLPEDADAHLVGNMYLSLGYDLSPAGDMNGDGYNDMAVATSSGSSAFVFAGPIGGTKGVAEALAQFDRPSSGDSIGQDVQGIGDQNADGYDDLLVSGYAVSGSSGIGYFVLGPVSGTASIEAEADATVSGDSGAYMSWYPSAGDVSGDGIVDSVLGAPGSNGTNGAAYVFFGPTTSGDLTAEDAGAAFVGLNANDWTGGCNAANGDVDGDGIDDLLVSAEQSAYLTSYQDGLAYLFYGPVSGTHTVDEFDTRFSGGAYGTHLGWFSTLGGDVDGDGLDDVALTAPNGVVDGTVYIVYAADMAGVEDFSMAKAGATVIGDPGALQQFGYYMDTAGDLDTDGYDDLAVGLYVSNGYYGTAWMYYGPVSGSMEATADASWIVYGSSTVQYVGGSTVFVDDVTGDGLDDLAIGAHNATVGKGSIYGAGMVLLFNGTAE